MLGWSSAALKSGAISTRLRSQIRFGLTGGVPLKGSVSYCQNGLTKDRERLECNTDGGELRKDSNQTVETVFAANLRSKCREFGSISALCREADLNRQQFARYLTGRGFPNAVNMRKICKALNTTEAELLQIDEESSSRLQIAKPMPFQFLDPLNIRSQFDRFVPELNEGFYFCYLPYNRIPGMLVKSLICFTRKERVLEFSRLTLLPSVSGPMSPLFKGKHKGIVCANDFDIYLIATNRFPPYQLSFMTVTKMDGTNKGVHSGKILTRSHNSLVSSKFCFVRVNSAQSRKSMIRELGIVSSNEPGVEPLVGAGLLT